MATLASLRPPFVQAPSTRLPTARSSFLGAQPHHHQLCAPHLIVPLVCRANQPFLPRPPVTCVQANDPSATNTSRTVSPPASTLPTTSSSPAASAQSPRRASVASRAAVTAQQPMPDEGGFFRLPAPGSLLSRIARAIAIPLHRPPSDAAEAINDNTPTTTAPIDVTTTAMLTAAADAPVATVAASAASAAATATVADSAMFSPVTNRVAAIGVRKSKASSKAVAVRKSGGRTVGWGSDLHLSRALPLPMTAPNAQPASAESVEAMMHCDPDVEDCREVVYQWTGRCTRCSGSGYVTFSRKKGKDFTGKCITCSGIGYVQRFTLRDDISVMEDIERPWRH